MSAQAYVVCVCVWRERERNYYKMLTTDEPT